MWGSMYDLEPVHQDELDDNISLDSLHLSEDDESEEDNDQGDDHSSAYDEQYYTHKRDPFNTLKGYIQQSPNRALRCRRLSMAFVAEQWPIWLWAYSNTDNHPLVPRNRALIYDRRPLALFYAQFALHHYGLVPPTAVSAIMHRYRPRGFRTLPGLRVGPHGSDSLRVV